MQKIALITGASAGFGKVAAEKLVQRGWKVIGTARRKERLEELQNSLGKDNFYPLAFDIRDISAIDQAVDSLPDDWKNIELLINNAGLALGLEKAPDCNLDKWLTMIDTNVRGLVAMTKKILPAMVAKNKGHIINISSIAGNYPYPGSNVYGASKAFVTQFSLNLRADLIGTAVRVSNVEPGLTDGTEFSDVRFDWDSNRARDVYKGVIGQNMTADDIAEIIIWIAEQPAHINVNRIEIMPVAQSFAGMTVAKNS
ncbi:MAG: SDR family NAD(P)-dependent oxidoreductase [Cardiobacteriaceae bacterium]|nr:SDR family NAD(P)-dependent oxidoreductase [Cardiobacteriaceae bacterium]